MGLTKRLDLLSHSKTLEGVHDPLSEGILDLPLDQCSETVLQTKKALTRLIWKPAWSLSAFKRASTCRTGREVVFNDAMVSNEGLRVHGWNEAWRNQARSEE